MYVDFILESFSNGCGCGCKNEIIKTKYKYN
jgi:hypothetical protein